MMRKFKTYQEMDELEAIRPIIAFPAVGKDMAMPDIEVMHNRYTDARKGFMARHGIYDPPSVVETSNKPQHGTLPKDKREAMKQWIEHNYKTRTGTNGDPDMIRMLKQRARKERKRKQRRAEAKR